MKNIRKIFFYPVLFIAMTFFTACKDSDEILVQETGDTFIAAIIADDFTQFRALVTPETFEKWGTVNYHHYAVLSPEIKAKLLPKVSDVKINGKEAQAKLSTGIPAENGEITVLHFTKIGRVWFINEPGLLVPEDINPENSGH